MKKRLAEYYFECGVVKTALNLFQELQLFDNVVNCLEIIGKKDEAVQLVGSPFPPHLQLQDRIREKGETPYLLCRIGELQKDPRLLERAWEVSHHRFARAQRMLGNFFYEQSDFAQCIPHYKEAVGRFDSVLSGSWRST